ncbi:MAG TPA: MFS transporter [Firmicutes bacterium]|nr:MFS transporter [Bacillota bacterium]
MRRIAFHKDLLQGLVPPLGRRAWRLLAGQALSQLGTGLTYPILLLYLHQARGIDLAAAGFVLATTSAAGLLALPLAGAFIDRVGAGRALVLALLICGAGTGGFALVRRPAEAFLAAALYGAGVAGMWNALSTLFARVVPPRFRGSVFGVNYALQNLGFGIGAGLGGLVLEARSPRSFQLLFTADAASFLLFAAILVLSGELRRAANEPGSPGPEAPVVSPGTSTGYRAVLRDRALLAFAGLNTLLSAASFSQLNSAFPAWATGPVGVSPRVVGTAFLANTLVIVVAQLFVLHYLLRGRRRTRATAAAALLFGTAWVFALTAGAVSGSRSAEAVLIASLMVFGFGETLLSPSLPALVNDLAPEELRGRYNAVYSLSWNLGPIIGPVVAGQTLARGWGAAHFAGLAVACALAAGAAVWAERLVPDRVNRGGHFTE